MEDDAITRYVTAREVAAAACEVPPPGGPPRFTARRLYPRIDWNEGESVIPAPPPSAAPSAPSDDPNSVPAFVPSASQRMLPEIMAPHLPTRSLLLFHDAGAGKTCAAAMIAQEFVASDPGFKVYVLAQRLVQSQFRRQLFHPSKYDRPNDSYGSCFAEEYVRRLPHRATMSDDELDAAVGSMINANFLFFGYTKFANYIERVRELAERRCGPGGDFQRAIDLLFGNCLIIVDEAHHLRTESGPSVDETTDDRAADDANVSTAGPCREALQYIVSHTRGARLLLLTATPMFHRADEIAWIMDLFAKNSKDPYDARFANEDIQRDLVSESVSPSTTKLLQEFAAKYVSRAEVSRSSAPPRLLPTPQAMRRIGARMLLRNGPPSKNKPVVDFLGRHARMSVSREPWARMIVAVTLSEPQASAYRRAVEYSGGLATLQMLSTVSLADRATEVSPGSAVNAGSTGRSGFVSRYELTADRTIRFRGPPELNPLAPANVRSYAAKIHAAVESAAVLFTNTQHQGVALIYCRFLWSGIMCVAAALEARGLRRLDPQGQGDYAILCGANVDAPRYGSLSDSLADVAKAGDRLRVILLTPAGHEGLDLKAVRQVHLLSTWWNRAATEQVIGRAVRTGSHNSLPLEWRDVTVFEYAAVLPETDETVDTGALRTAFESAKAVARVSAVISEHAIGGGSDSGSLNVPHSDSRPVDAHVNVLSSHTHPKKRTLTIRVTDDEMFFRRDAHVAAGLAAEYLREVEYATLAQIERYVAQRFHAHQARHAVRFGVLELLEKEQAVAAGRFIVRAAATDRLSGLSHARPNPWVVPDELSTFRMAATRNESRESLLQGIPAQSVRALLTSNVVSAACDRLHAVRAGLTRTGLNRTSIDDRVDMDRAIDALDSESLVVLMAAGLVRSALNAPYRMTKDLQDRDDIIVRVWESAERGGVRWNPTGGTSDTLVFLPRDLRVFQLVRSARQVTSADVTAKYIQAYAAYVKDSIQPRRVSAYVTVNTRGPPKFLIARPSPTKSAMATGTVCAASSTAFTRESLLDMVRSKYVADRTTIQSSSPVVGTAPELQSLSKSGLCERYEISLRATNEVLRPVESFFAGVSGQVAFGPGPART